MTEMLCKDCDKIVLFVTPECDDAPEDCGDLMCVLCGAAVTLGALLISELDAIATDRRSSAA
jgi:hypothetical protein